MTSGKRVTVTVEGIGEFSLPAGEKLRAALRREGVLIDGACLDSGTCGRCVVRILEGEGAATGAELAILRAQGLTDSGHRLACRVVLSSDLTVKVEPERLLEVDRAGRWKETWGSPLWEPARFFLDPSPVSNYGVAFDLGTTSIAAALFVLRDGRPLDIVARANPQLPFGADLLSRLQAAEDRPGAAKEMRDGVREAMGRMLRSLASRNGVSPGQVGFAVVVGNSAMRQLALGRPPRSLLNPPFTPTDPGPVRLSFAELGWEGGGEALFPAVLGGFVGSDALAALLAARSDAQSGAGAGLLLDIGTNCELLAWERNDILVASAPAGPAFEGGHISRGMRAEEGAVFRVRLDEGGVLGKAIGGGVAKGICGTGLVDAAAELLRMGLLDRRGLMRAGAHPALSAAGLDLSPPGARDPLLFTPADLATLQKAKAAVAAGIGLLLEKLGRPAAPRVWLAGAFGSRLDVAAAVRIGLLPALPPSRFLAAGNAALVGAAYLLLSPQARAEAERLATRVEHVSLAEEPAFEERYLDALAFPQGDRP